MRTFSAVSALLLGGLLWVGMSMAQDVVKESSTGKTFPTTVKYSYGGGDYTMDLTGVTVRKKFIFKVYGVGHYMQGAPHGKSGDVLKYIQTDGQAKQLTMVFVRDVDAGKIRETYMDGFNENAGADEMSAIMASVTQFVGFFDRDVKENDEFVLRWLPGGTVVATVAGNEKPAIVDVRFARVLWSIWFGDNSIVDRDELVERLITK